VANLTGEHYVSIQFLKRYVYDILIPPGVDLVPFTPRPLDGEVESFEVRIPFLLGTFFIISFGSSYRRTNYCSN